MVYDLKAQVQDSFYILFGLHALHVIGGIVALTGYVYQSIFWKNKKL